jgi:spore coat polysaccharide biosynthesis predicted glycosyltransferase SpsG
VKMHVLLVSEFGKSIGYGHLSRLIAIAEELIVRNYSYCFHLYDDSDEVANFMIKSSGLSFECKCNSRPFFLLVDSYNIDILLPKINALGAIRIIQIVDDINKPFFADGYIEASPINHWKPMNQNASILEFKMSPILRMRFDNSALKSKVEFTSNSKILITLGSSSLTIDILKALVSAIRVSKFSAHDLYISTNSNGTQMINLVATELGVKSLDSLNGSPEIFNGFDLVISACGVTGWELLQSNSPCVFIGTVNNQQSQLDYFINNNLADGLMFSENHMFIEKTVQKLNVFSNNFNLRNINNGRRNVVDWLENQMITLSK